jgi:hypothetical protein
MSIRIEFVYHKWLTDLFGAAERFLLNAQNTKFVGIICTDILDKLLYIEYSNQVYNSIYYQQGPTIDLYMNVYTYVKSLEIFQFRSTSYNDKISSRQLC